MDKRLEFGQRIVELRDKAGISQEQLAERAGITSNNLSRIETGRYSPGIDILIRIGDAIGMKLTYTK